MPNVENDYQLLFKGHSHKFEVSGNSITVPGMSKITGDLGFLELLNAMGGGALEQFSIFAC